MTYIATTRDLLAATILCIAEQGWVSRKVANQNGSTSTADKALNLLYKLKNLGPSDILFENLFSKMNEASDEVEEILEWVDNMVADSEYLRKVQKICSNEKLHSNQIGTAASAVVAFRNENLANERKKEAAERQKVLQDENKEAAWVGQVGDKFGRKLSKKDRDAGLTEHPAIMAELVFKKPLESSTLLRFKDANGNLWTWFSMSREDDPDVGKTFKITGTLKKHSEYKGVKSNLLSRCILEEVVETPAES